jgi:GntR family transcriptional regulator
MPSRPTQKSRSTGAGGLTGRKLGRGVARYYQLYELLSGALHDGTIPAGSTLPSEPELVTRYRVSRTTVRRALARLEDEGRIVRRRGSGTFARHTRETARLTLNLHEFYDEVSRLPAGTSVVTLRFEQATVPPAVRELEPQSGSRALMIQRLHRYRGAPYQLTTAYIPEPIGRRIRRSMLGGSTLLTVLDRIGPRTTSTNHTTGAVAADADAARHLDVPLGTPLIRMRAVFTDDRGQPRAVCENLCRPDRFHVTVELERHPARGSQPPWRLKGR